jgi:hypothetical protein
LPSPEFLAMYVLLDMNLVRLDERIYTGLGISSTKDARAEPDSSDKSQEKQNSGSKSQYLNISLNKSKNKLTYEPYFKLKPNLFCILFLVLVDSDLLITKFHGNLLSLVYLFSKLSTVAKSQMIGNLCPARYEFSQTRRKNMCWVGNLLNKG